MATYIQGLTDYIPQLQPFQPDYNFLGNMLQTKQSQFDAAHKQLDTMYGTLLNAPLSRDQNIQRRDSFFKSINQDIQRMSGLDLSLQQNQDSAMQVFKGFYEDKNMVKDMVWTKNFYNQVDKGQMLKSCPDPDKCGGSWWQGGDEELQNRLSDFKKATDQDAMNFANVSYTPHINVTEKAIKAAKDAGFSVKMDSVRGGYIVTTKNGEAMVSSLSDFYVSKFGSDPQVMAMYNAMAYNNRKKWVNENLANFGGNEDETNLQYVNNLLAEKPKLDKQLKGAELKGTYANNNKALIADHIKKNGVDPKVSQNVIDAYLGIDEDANITNGNTKLYKDAVNITNNIGINKGNVKAALANIDQLAAMAFLRRESHNAAQEYSNLTVEQEMKADPYSLASYSSQLSLRNSLAMADTNYKIWEKKEDYKDAKRKKLIMDIYGPDKLTPKPNTPGTGTDVITSASKDNSEFRAGLVDKMRESQSQMLENYVTMISAKNAGATDSKQKLYFQEAIKNTFAGTGLNIDNLLKGDKAEINKISSLGTPLLSNSFTMSKSYSNPYKGKGIGASDFFTKEFYEANAANIMEVDKNAMIFNHFEDQWKATGKDVAERVKANYSKDGVVDKKMGSLMDMYLDASKDIGYKPFTDEQITEAWQGKNPEVRQFLAKYATEFAKKHSKDFQSQAGVDQDPNSPTYGAEYTAFDAAKKYAYENSRKIFKDYSSNYDEFGQSYRKKAGMGKGSNALTSMAYGAMMDSDENLITQSRTKTALGFFQNYSALSDNPDVRIAFGDAKQIPSESDPKAKAIADAFYSELLSPSKATDDGRARGNWVGQRIAGDNADYVGFTFYPNELWAQKPSLRGAKNSGITGGGEYKDGITMFLPKNMVNNSFMEATTASPYDYEFETTNQLNLNAFNDVKAIVTKVGNRKQVELIATLINDKTGNPYIYKKTEIIGTTDLANQVIVDDWMPKLQVLQNMIDLDKNDATIKYGTKDIDALLNSQMQ